MMTIGYIALGFGLGLLFSFILYCKKGLSADPNFYTIHLEKRLEELDKENELLHHKLNTGLQKRGLDGRYVNKKG
jgi:hypothetical protein